MNKIIASFLVTYRITGYAIHPCEDQKQVDPLIGACITPIDVVRSQSFDRESEADEYAKNIKSLKRPYTIGEVKIFGEKSDIRRSKTPS